MSTHQHPVGRPSKRVYRRRRAMVLALLLLIVIVVVLLATHPWGSRAGRPALAATSRASDASGHASTSVASAPHPVSPVPAANGSSPGGLQQCPSGQVTVTAVTDAESYPAGHEPKLAFTITNTGAGACSIDAGTDRQTYSITSGSTQIWQSGDCQSDPRKTLVVLQPNETLRSAWLSWDRTFSSTSTCHAKRPAVTAGGAAYHYTVSVGGVASSNDVQFELY